MKTTYTHMHNQKKRLATESEIIHVEVSIIYTQCPVTSGNGPCGGVQQAEINKKSHIVCRYSLWLLIYKFKKPERTSAQVVQYIKKVPVKRVIFLTFMCIKSTSRFTVQQAYAVNSSMLFLHVQKRQKKTHFSCHFTLFDTFNCVSPYSIVLNKT